jgi:hypothetical protein
MDRKRMVVGWQRAGKKLFAEVKLPMAKIPNVTVEVAAEMEATRRRIALSPQRLTVHSDLTGMERGKLFAWHKSQSGDEPFYWCLCACGNFCEVSAHALLRGLKNDCGCLAEECKRVRSAQRRQRWAKVGRKRAPWKRFHGLFTG